MFRLKKRGIICFLVELCQRKSKNSSRIQFSEMVRVVRTMLEIEAMMKSDNVVVVDFTDDRYVALRCPHWHHLMLFPFIYTPVVALQTELNPVRRCELSEDMAATFAALAEEFGCVDFIKDRSYRLYVIVCTL